MESALHNRDADLQQAFQEGGKNVEKKRDKRNNNVKKMDFFRQLITIVITDQRGKPLPGCEWKLTRNKLTEATLMGQIKKCPLKDVEIDYFIENSGTPFWMEDMMLKAQPSPIFYIIVPKVRRLNKDILDDPKYEGQTAMMITNVPNRAKDEKSIVDAETLRAYVMCAIIEVDPYSRPFFEAIDETNEAIKAIDKKIKAVAKLVFREPNGDLMDDEKAGNEREVLYNAFSEERIKADRRLKSKQEGLRKQLEWRSKMGIEFQQIGHDENTDTCTWYFRLFGTKDAGEIEDLLMEKDDWAGIKLASWCDDPKVPPWAGRGKLPVGSSPAEPDYSLLQINVQGARIARLPNGVGTLKALDRKSVAFSAEEFSYYYGSFEMGKKHGRGIEINDVGIFAGRWIEGQKRGNARWDLADGTTIVGDFKVNNLHDFSENKVFVNPYLDGEPQGKVEILFSDGALYRGHVRDGRINGEGEYQSGFGELYIGTFKDGVLNGDKCYFKNHAGEQFEGKFCMGELDGQGRYENERGDTYEGYFDLSMKHGRGVARYKNRGNYRGYFLNDLKYGKGELDYGRRTKSEKKKQQEARLAALKKAEDRKKQARDNIKNKVSETREEKEAREDADDDDKEARMFEFKNTYQGFFFGNNVTNGGITTNVDTQISAVVSRRDTRSLLPVTSVIRRNIMTMKELRRKNEKFNDMEHHVRGEIRLKKSRIYSQQKHFTKRAMYLEETSVISKKDVDARTVVRKERMERIDLSKITPQTALIPRIKNITSNLDDENYLRKHFFAIKPDPDFGDVRKVRRTLARIAASDFEEVQERQRYLKYDLIWARAEAAFISKRKANNAT